MIGPAPLPPAPLAPAPFPWLVTLAPLALSVIVAVSLRSPIALLMGVLGPVLVAASWWQSQRNRRHEASAGEAEYDQKLFAYERELATAEQAERLRASIALPSIEEQSANPLARRPPGTLVRVGRGVWMPPSSHPLYALGAISSMPAAIDASAGVALVAGEEGVDVWRMLYAQWVRQSGDEGIDPPVGSPGGDIPRDIRGLSRAVWVDQAGKIPEECGVVLVLDAPNRARVLIPGDLPRSIKPDRLSHPQLSRILEGFDQAPREVESDPLAPARAHLIARLSPEGPPIDLVREGPHAVIWGATGSGKSVAACALVSSIAKRYPPRDVACVLVDFKGGAGLRPLTTLSHTVGVVTDLEPERSDRARVGLEAEMLARERIMAEHAVQDCRDLPDSVVCPRLIVVIDEVAWLCEVSPAWASTIADIARRGRSLGIHLVLATQRVGGALARGVMANVSLRICARVSDEAEVTEWMPGVSRGHVSAMNYLEPGRVLVSGAHTPPHWHPVCPQWPPPEEGPASGWRVWSEELPKLFPWRPGVWGAGDDATDRSHADLTDNPLDSGSTLVIGDRRTGKTNAARALAALARDLVAPGPDIALVWLAVRSAKPSQVVFIDDADDLLHRAGAEAETFVLDALEGSRATLLLTSGARHRLTRHLARLAPHRIVLSVLADEHAVWEGPGGSTPGRGRLGGRDVQVAFPAPEPERWRAPTWQAGDTSPVVISADPEWWTRYDTAGCLSPSDLPAQAATLGDLLAHHPVIIDGVDHKETRAITLGRITLPPLQPPEGMCWVWSSAGVELVSRAGLRPRRP